MQGSYVIGVDLGATKIASALVAEDGSVLAADQTFTDPSRGVEAVLDDIAGHVRRLKAKAPGGVLGVGIGSPGQVFTEEGVVCNAVNLGWDEVAVVREVQSRLAEGLPMWIHKDANASVLGEYYFGAGRGCRDLVYLGLGSGLGAGILLGGRLVIGSNHSAAELGHLSLDPAGRPCTCGLRGCAETITSGPGLLAEAREMLARGKLATRLVDDDGLTPATVIAAARDGDALAADVVERVAGALGRVMAVCVAVLNPARFVIGGGLALAAFDLLVPGALAELQQRTMPISHRGVQVVRSGVESSAVGSACLVWYELEHRNPERR